MQQANYDVAIVGAGPAGSLAARALSRSGQRVLLLERTRFPRPKVCGDALNPAAWPILERQRLVAPIHALPHSPLAGVTFLHQGRVFSSSRFPAEQYPERAIRRDLFDQALLQAAQASGTVVEEGVTLKQVQVAPDNSQVVLRTSGGEVSARLLLGADGRNSLVAQTTGLSARVSPKRDPRIAWQAMIPLETLAGPHDPGAFIHLHGFEDGYYGICRVDEEHADLCLVLRSSNAGPPQAIALRFFPQVPALAWRSLFPLTRPANRLGRGPVWLVGDAARTMEPLTGQGITMALATGEAAARAALPYLAREISLSTAFTRYEHQHRELYRHVLRVNRLAQWFARSPTRLHWGFRLLGNFPGAMGFLTRQVHPEAVAA